MRPPRYLTWGWSVEVASWNNREPKYEYSLACLTDDALYVRTGYKTLRDRVAAVAELNTFEPPAVFKDKYSRVPLSAIYRLRYCESLGSLELLTFDDRATPIVDAETKQTRVIFTALHKLLAPSVTIESESLSGLRNLRGPLIGVGITTIIAGLMIAWPQLSDGKQPHKGRRRILLDLMDSIVYGLGPTTAAVVAVLAILASVAIVAYRHLHPLQADVVVVKS